MIETEIKKLTSAVTTLTEALHQVRLPATSAVSAAVKSEQPSDDSPPVKTDVAAAPSDAADVPAAGAAKPTTTEPVAEIPAAGAAAPAAAIPAAIPAVAPAAGAAEVAPAVSPDVAPVVEVTTPTKKQMVDKFILLAQEKDRTVAVALLAEFGVTKLPELKDKAQWGPFVAKIDALLAA